jgi:hypothetical protein
LLGTKLAFVLFAFITAAVIASIVIPSVIISSILIARRVTAIIVVHVFALVGNRFFVGVCIIKQRFRVRFLSPRFILSGLRIESGRVRGLRSARHSENAE